jgi:CAAX protease family protein
VPPSSLKPADRGLVAYLALFFAAWTGYVLWIYPRVAAFGEGSFALVGCGIAVRLLLWLLPVFLMLFCNDRVPPLRALGLVDYWRRGVLAGIVIGAILLAAALLRFGWPSAPYVTWGSLLGPSFSVGFFEEIPFRGFILQKLWTRMGFWLANVLTSLLFVAVHLPGWLSLHLFNWALAANISVFGLAAGAVFRYSRSLWACIIGHDANDFISFVLFHGR